MDRIINRLPRKSGLTVDRPLLISMETDFLQSRQDTSAYLFYNEPLNMSPLFAVHL